MLAVKERYRVCRTDDDFAKFAHFFIRHRKAFSDRFSLVNAILHMLYTIEESRIMIIESEADQTIGAMLYRYQTADGNPDPDGDTAFVDSVVLIAALRSSRMFVRGFRHLVRHMLTENPKVQTFQFCAMQSNVYLTRLYSKFASIIGEKEGEFGMEHIFSADIRALAQYLGKSDK